MAPRQKLIAIHPVHGYAIQPQQDLKTMKRNARERNRVQAVNSCFENLRRCVPSAAVYKKMSKVNIVHHALEYIHQLMEILQDDDQPSPCLEKLSSAASPASHFHSPSFSFNHPSSSMSAFNSSSSASMTSSSSSTYEWAMRAQASHFLPSPFLTPNTPHFPPHHLMYSPGYQQYSSTSLAANSPAISEVESCPQQFPPFSPVTPPSPDEEEDVLDAIVEWQSC